MIGTPSYMSPEQIQGQAIDRRTDIFSAGILFYQLLTGQKPFEGQQWALAKKIIQDDPVWPSQVAKVPAVVDGVVARALAKEPEQRFPTARAFADALRRLAAGKPPQDPDETIPLPTAAMRAESARNEAEQEFWNEVKDSKDPEDLKLYIEQFPKGVFVGEAQRKVAELSAKKA
jgi:serine/threonine-protein kinase